MDLLTLPRLHPSIPSLIPSPRGEEGLLEALRERARAGLPVKRRRSGEPINRALARHLEQWLIPGATKLRCFDASIAIAEEAQWGDLQGAGDGMTLCWEARTIQSAVEVLTIGLGIGRMEQAHTGLGESVLATLQEVSTALYGHIINTPRDLIVRFDDVRWDGALQDSMARHTGEDACALIDSDVREAFIASGYWEPEGSEEDEVEMTLPSDLFRAVEGGGLGWKQIMHPRKRIKVTQPALIDAGFSASQAQTIEHLVNVEVPRRTRAFLRGHRDQGHFTGWDQFPACVQLTQEMPDEIVQFLDNEGQGRMEYGVYEAPFSVAMHPKKCPPGVAPIDPFKVMATFLNLMHRTDQLLAVLCD